MDSPRIGIVRWRPDDPLDRRAAVRRLAGSLLQGDRTLDAPLGERPRLVGNDGAECGYVSLSHTHVAGAVAVADSPIGVDLEWLQRRVRWQALARAHFSADEQSWLARRTRSGGRAAFLGLWTLKEAWLKAQGLGVWRMGEALFAPVGRRHWRIPGAGWRGECRFLGGDLVAAAIWRDATPPPKWLEAGGVGWAEAGYETRWQASSEG